MLEATKDFLYPKGGFRRAIQYVVHRMRRLPDAPHRIARGVFAGCFASFPPLFGVQMLTAALLAWVLRGNILAALLATFLSNPITTPFIAVGSLQLGHWMLGIDSPLDFVSIVAAFTGAGAELWANFLAIFTDDLAHWENLSQFFHTIYWPYFVGSILPGIVFSLICYYITLPLIHAYQKLRAGKLRERFEKRRLAKARMAEAKMQTGDDDGPASP
ncbi:MAG: DUF2062 domain-containing protein [Paracoccaceae bacterium]